jgi:hypothetical protein
MWKQLKKPLTGPEVDYVIGLSTGCLFSFIGAMSFMADNMLASGILFGIGALGFLYMWRAAQRSRGSPPDESDTAAARPAPPKLEKLNTFISAVALAMQILAISGAMLQFALKALGVARRHGPADEDMARMIGYLTLVITCLLVGCLSAMFSGCNRSRMLKYHGIAAVLGLLSVFFLGP